MVAETLGDMLRIDHDAAADVLAFDRELGRARAAEHGPALRPHLLQLAQPALVAPPPRGDASGQPVELDPELCVELLRGPRLFLMDCLGPGLETAEADFRSPQLAAIEPETGRGQPAE